MITHHISQIVHNCQMISGADLKKTRAEREMVCFVMDCFSPGKSSDGQSLYTAVWTSTQLQVRGLLSVFLLQFAVAPLSPLKEKHVCHPMREREDSLKS